jgi:hypothetical protein
VFLAFKKTGESERIEAISVFEGPHWSMAKSFPEFKNYPSIKASPISYRHHAQSRLHGDFPLAISMTCCGLHCWFAYVVPLPFLERV